MPIKWKTRDGVNPQILLDKIDSIKSISADGRVSYTGYEYFDLFASLFSLIDIPRAVSSEINVDSLVSKSLAKAAREDTLTKKGLMGCLNEVARSHLSTQEVDYRLLTSLSIKGELPFRRLSLGSERLHLVNGSYPKKYESRTKLTRYPNTSLSLEHSGYTRVIVYTKSKSIKGAAAKALDSLDLARALISLFSNADMELWGNNFAPINRVRLGEVHSLHYRSGEAISTDFWFEPHFVQASPFVHNRPGALKKNFDRCLKRLNRKCYPVDLKDSLIQYVRAFDEKDPGTAAIKMWGAIETLATPGRAAYDKLVKRCSFLFEEETYHRQMLEHLREFRNSTVHSGIQSERAKTYCYQMQFYFRRLILFHLMEDFKSLDEANRFLDLPADATSLLNKKSQIIKALEFRKIRTQAG